MIENKKTVSFGATGYSDFAEHKDEGRKKSYIARHKFNHGSKDYKTAGAKKVWNKPTTEAAS